MKVMHKLLGMLMEMSTLIFLAHKLSIPNLSTGSTTRDADVCTITTPSGVTSITETFADDTTNVITSIPTTYRISEGKIKKVIMI
jgi:hypothetical protein